MLSQHWLSFSRNALTEKLQSVHDTTYLLHQKTKERSGYRQTLKDTVENEPENKEAKKQQQDDDEQYNTAPMIKLVCEYV